MVGLWYILEKTSSPIGFAPSPSYLVRPRFSINVPQIVMARPIHQMEIPIIFELGIELAFPGCWLESLLPHEEDGVIPV